MRPLAIDFDAIRVALVAAVRLGVGLDHNHVIMMESEVAGAPRPSLPYMALKVTTAAMRRGNDACSVQAISADGSRYESYSGSRQMNVSFQSFGQSHEQAYGMMALWQASLELPEVQELLRRSDVSIWQVGNVVDLTQLVGTGYEGRAQMDVFFGVLSNITTWTPSIRVASAEGTTYADQTSEPDLAVTVSTGDNRWQP